MFWEFIKKVPNKEAFYTLGRALPMPCFNKWERRRGGDQNVLAVRVIPLAGREGATGENSREET